MRRAAALAVVAGLVFGSMSATSAMATTGEPPLDPQIVAIMEEVPGGVLLDAYHVVWPALDMALTVPHSEGAAASARAAVGGCATTRACLFTGYNLSGTILSWGTCGYHSIPNTFIARSVAHARSSGSTQARAGTSVVATAGANSWVNIYGTTDNILCLF